MSIKKIKKEAKKFLEKAECEYKKVADQAIEVLNTIENRAPIAAKQTKEFIQETIELAENKFGRASNKKVNLDTKTDGIKLASCNEISLETPESKTGSEDFLFQPDNLTLLNQTSINQSSLDKFSDEPHENLHSHSIESTANQNQYIIDSSVDSFRDENLNNLNQAEFIDYQTDNSIIPNKVIPQEFEELIENKLNNLIKAKFDNFIKTDFINIVKAECNNLIDEPSPYNKMTSLTNRMKLIEDDMKSTTSLYTKLIDYNMKSTTSLTDHMKLMNDHMKDLTSAESHYTEMQELDTNNYNQDDNNIILGGIDDAGLVEVN